MVVVYVTLTFCISIALARWVVRRRGRSLFAAASEGAVNGLVHLGPTYVKLGQIVASSPGLFPKPLTSAVAAMPRRISAFLRGAGSPAR